MMDDLDQAILSSANKVIVETYPASWTIYIRFGIAPTADPLQCISRIEQWASPAGHRELIRHYDLPRTIDTHQVGLWVAKQLQAHGKAVTLMKQIGSGQFAELPIE